MDSGIVVMGSNRGNSAFVVCTSKRRDEDIRAAIVTYARTFPNHS
jgi:hypothetical protein